MSASAGMEEGTRKTMEDITLKLTTFFIPDGVPDRVGINIWILAVRIDPDCQDHDSDHQDRIMTVQKSVTISKLPPPVFKFSESRDSFCGQENIRKKLWC